MKTVNGVTLEGSAKEYNKGFTKAFKAYKENGFDCGLTLNVLCKMINNHSNSDKFNHGLNDASRVIARLSK